VADPFELTDGAVDVLTISGERRPVAVPAGFSDIAFRNALACVYTLFMRWGRVPNLDECFKFHNRIPKETYAALFVTPEFKEALDYRGVSYDPNAGLTLQQQMVLTKLSDVTDTRSLKAKLNELKVPMPTYQAWLKNPQFTQILNEQSKNAFAEYLPDIRRSLVGRAINGGQRETELIFAITGEWDPAQRQVEDAKEVVAKVIGAVIKHADAATRERIFAELKGHAVAYEVLHTRELEGTDG
jgi:hypothetical protein